MYSYIKANDANKQMEVSKQNMEKAMIAQEDAMRQTKIAEHEAANARMAQNEAQHLMEELAKCKPTKQ